MDPKTSCIFNLHLFNIRPCALFLCNLESLMYVQNVLLYYNFTFVRSTQHLPVSPRYLLLNLFMSSEPLITN